MSNELTLTPRADILLLSSLKNSTPFAVFAMFYRHFVALTNHDFQSDFTIDDMDVDDVIHNGVGFAELAGAYQAVKGNMALNELNDNQGTAEDLYELMPESVVISYDSEERVRLLKTSIKNSLIGVLGIHCTADIKWFKQRILSYAVQTANQISMDISSANFDLLVDEESVNWRNNQLVTLNIDLSHHRLTSDIELKAELEFSVVAKDFPAKTYAVIEVGLDKLIEAVMYEPQAVAG